MHTLHEALEAGWSRRRGCDVLELPERRAHRWDRRRAAGRLADGRPGGGPVHAILPEQREAILALFEAWGERDRSPRRLAQRGSYLGLVWVSPATVRRVLVLADKNFRPIPRPPRGQRRPFPDWASYTPNSIWIYDSTHLQAEGLYEAALARAATGRVDPDADDGLTPILLAVSDNGSQMIARDTRRFMVLLAIAQHFGRPATPLLTG